MDVPATPGVWFAVTPEHHATLPAEQWCLPEADGRTGTGSGSAGGPGLSLAPAVTGRHQRGRWPVPVTLVCSGSVPGWAVATTSSRQSGEGTVDMLKLRPPMTARSHRSCFEHGPEFLAAAGSVRVRLQAGWQAPPETAREPACEGLPRCRVLQLGPQPPRQQALWPPASGGALGSPPASSFSCVQWLCWNKK